MSSQVLLAAGFLAILVGLWVQAHLFTALKSDPPASYKLFAVRDRLVRLVADGEIERTDPHFVAIYNNVNLMLASSHVLSGPRGWKIAELQGKHFAKNPSTARRLDQLPDMALPSPLVPLIEDLAGGLKHLLENHFGIFVQIDSRRREVRRLQRKRAKRFLAMIPA